MHMNFRGEPDYRDLWEKKMKKLSFQRLQQLTVDFWFQDVAMQTKMPKLKF